MLTRRASFDAVSMRELAYELGVGAMTIYNYVANKDALAGLVADHLLRGVSVPPPEAGAWHQRLLSLTRDRRASLRRYRDLPLHSSVEAERLEQAARAIIDDAGFNLGDAELAFATLWAALGNADIGDDALEFGFEAVVDTLKQRPAQRPTERPARRRLRAR